MRLEPLAPAMGARIDGLDLRDASADLVGVLRTALLEHHLLVVSNQDLDAPALQAFGGRWGELLTHPASVNAPNPYVQTLGKPAGRKAEDAEQQPSGVPPSRASRPRPRRYGAWHSDMSWHPTPPWITMLHARTLPTWGGDTGFANQQLAWEALDVAGRDRGRVFRRDLPTSEDILGRRANHTGKQFGPDVPDSIHPVVRTHNESGRAALYVNPEFTSRIEGLEDAASRVMLYALWAHATGMEFVYRHRWRPGDICIWDNRSVMHTSIADYTEPRSLSRVVVKGDVPV